MIMGKPPWHEKKIFPRDDFLKWVPIFSINNFVNPFEGGRLILQCVSPLLGFRELRHRNALSEL